jgi:XRE family transcriptional regulator, aerobic/anaerobic benzoate catabolism transcriptional regulator
MRRDSVKAMQRRPPRSPLLAVVGGRTRALRERRGMTQRGLAEASGVSARFLAQLEAGDGNISLERFDAVARALGSSPAALLDGAREPSNVGDGDGDDERLRLRATLHEILERRSTAELAETRKWLEARFSRRAAPVVALLGLRGAGKSTVGPRLARRLALRFVELDAAIEEAAGLSLAEIFELHGESYYRRLERETLMSLLADGEGVVVATGGSIVNDKETYKLLRRRAITVWLRARPEDHWNRVIQQGDQRPMAQHPHAMAELRALLAARERLYAEAEHVIDTSRVDVDAAVEKLARELQPGAR